jgi:hypothetical protein
MAGWEEELAVLLSELGVKQEEAQPRLQQSRKPMRSDVKRREQSADALLWAGDDSEPEDDAAWMSDLDQMRHEVNTIVSQVVLLMQRGDLDIALKEDVMVVLRALRRRVPILQLSSMNDEVYLESACALLHFCRLVLQLSESATEDA